MGSEDPRHLAWGVNQVGPSFHMECGGMTPPWGRDMSRPGKARSCPRIPKRPSRGTKSFRVRLVKETGMRPSISAEAFFGCQRIPFGVYSS